MNIRRVSSAIPFGSSEGAVEFGDFIPLTRGSVTGRAVIDRAAVHVEDTAVAPEEEFPISRELQRRIGGRAALSVPLMREDRAIGAIALWRMEARPFTDKQIALVKTFADQAAIENVRLFDEVQARTHELAESLQVVHHCPPARYRERLLAAEIGVWNSPLRSDKAGPPDENRQTQRHRQYLRERITFRSTRTRAGRAFPAPVAD